LDNYVDIPFTWGGLKPSIYTNTLEINFDSFNPDGNDYFDILYVGYNLTPSLMHRIDAVLISSEL
jgi:hypothetical protein